ncbi:MAG: DNA polymerase III subunit alpha [Oligoflexales bacterium]
MSDFVHLHVHSEYSLQDGCIPIKALIQKAKDLGHTHVALTDHGQMHGAVEFYQTAKAQGLTPVIGCEVYTKGTEETEECQKEWVAPLEGFHLVVLAKNTQGYKNLMKISSAGYMSTEERKNIPVVPEETLQQYRGDLVVLSSSVMGELGCLLQALRMRLGAREIDFSGEEPESFALRAYAKKMKDRYGDDFYVELVWNNLPGQDELLRDSSAFADFFGFSCVATGDVYYLDADFAETHTLAVAMKNSLTFKRISHRQRDARFHFLNKDEFFQTYDKWPQAISNTIEIAEKCSDVEIQMDTYHFPRLPLGGENPSDALVRLSKEGLEARFTQLAPLYGDTLNDTKKQEYYNRLEYELQVIIQMGFPDYFLIVQDFINWAKEQGIPVGPGRGSGAGSLVAYALKITDLDPLPYTLIFERFLNPERVSMPDFDVDFCQWRREEVIQYCIKKYGRDKVAQITTFGRMNAKAVVKNVGRAMNLRYSMMDRFTKLFPNDLGLTLAKALDQEPKILEMMNEESVLKDCMDSARKLEGLASHSSVHAAGVIISDGPMTDYIPVYSTDGEGMITQYEMKPAEKVGLVKFDFLGLKTLTVIQKAIDIIPEDLDIAAIPLDDDKVFKMVSTGHTVGIFQLESLGMMQLIRKLQPSSFEDVIALVALYRPGPLGSGMVDSFVERKHGREKIVCLHISIEPILRETYGLILYQEQVQKIAAILANYSLGEADILRRAMGKKIPEEMAKQRDRFLEGARENEIDEDLAAQIFDLMAEFAKYGFNKSHSAAYGLVSYQTAWLKTHYPEHFMAAIMTCDMDNTDKLIRYMQDCRRMNFEVVQPCLNQSELEFHVEKKKTIRFALAAIKGIGSGVLEPLIAERNKGGVFLSVADLCRRCHLGRLGKKNFQTLILAGVLDDFKVPRYKLLEISNDIVAYSAQCHEDKTQGQKSLFDDKVEEAVAPWGIALENCSEPIVRYEDLFEEKRLIGMFLTGHPYEFYQPLTRAFSNEKLNSLHKLQKRTEVYFVALLGSVSQRRTKKGRLMSYVPLEQADMSLEAVMFEKDEAFEFPAAQTIVWVKGQAEVTEDGDVRLVLKHIEPFEPLLEDSIRSLRVTFSSAMPKSRVKSWAQSLQQHPGTIPVSVLVKHASAHAVLPLKTEARIGFSSALLTALQDFQKQDDMMVQWDLTARQS